METSVPGVFAVGDVRHRSVKRVASAVGAGAIAVQLVHAYLAEQRTCPGGHRVAPGRQNGPMLLSEIAATSEAVASTPARLAKVTSLADCLRRLDPDEVGIA